MSTAVVKKQSRPIDAVRAELTSAGMQSQLKMALPKHVDIDRFNRVAITAIQQNPGLLDADRRSLFAACMTAAQLGLVTDGVLGQAYLVPYKGKVQLIPGYRGLLTLARQSGEIASIDVDTIHEKDEVEFVLGDESRLVVKPKFGDRGDIIGAFAVATFKDGSKQRAVMTKDEIEVIRKRSPSGNSPAWKDNFGEMAKKTVFRRLAKMLPLSTEAQKAVGIAEAADGGKAANLRDGDLVTEDLPDDPQQAARQARKSRLDAAAEKAAQQDAQDAEWQEVDTPDPAPEPAGHGAEEPSLQDVM